MKSVADQKFVFGDVTIDPQANIAVIAGREKRVEPKLIALLTYLAQRPKQVVTRQELTEAIWPDVIVGEESVTQAIFALRNLLGDDAKQPKYIETIPKKGYRFLADVTPFEITSPEIHQPSKRSKNKLVIVSISVGIGLIIALAVARFFVWKEPATKIVSILPATRMGGIEGDMAINQKGLMAFIHYHISGSTLYVKDLKTGTQERITSPEWYITAQPVWLDDNTLLYTRCSLDRACQIVRQPLRELPKVLFASKGGIVEAIVRKGAPDEIWFNEADSDKEDFAVFNTRTKKYEPLRDRYNNLPKHISHPQFSPDGEKLYFVYKFEKTKLMVLDLSTSEVSVVSEQFEELHSISFNNQHDLMIAGNMNSVPGLWFLSPKGGEPELFFRSTSGEAYVRAIVAPDENAVYGQVVSLNIDNLIIDKGKDITSELPGLNSTGADTSAIFSHDEQFIYFVSNRSGFREIWCYDLAKKLEKQVTRIKTPLLENLAISHNGQRIAAMYMDNSQWVMGIFSTFNGELLSQKPGRLMPLNWSIDDESIYVANLQNNDQNLIRVDSHTQEFTKVQDKAGRYAEEFDNGKSLIFYDLNQNVFVQRDLANGKDKVISSRINEFQFDYHVSNIDTKNEILLTTYRDQKTYQLRRYHLNITANNKKAEMKPDVIFTLEQAADQITYINNIKNKIIISKVIAAEGDILKFELGD